MEVARLADMDAKLAGNLFLPPQIVLRAQPPGAPAATRYRWGRHQRLLPPLSNASYDVSFFPPPSNAKDDCDNNIDDDYLKGGRGRRAVRDCCKEVNGSARNDGGAGDRGGHHADGEDINDGGGWGVGHDARSNKSPSSRLDDEQERQQGSRPQRAIKRVSFLPGDTPATEQEWRQGGGP
jgi:hypothetical protein